MYQCPDTLFTPTGPWSLLCDEGHTVYLAGLRGIDPATDTIVPDLLDRVRQIFRNLVLACDSVGLTLDNVSRLTIYVTDMAAHRPMVNQVQLEFWGNGPYPPRSIIGVQALNQGDWVEVEATLTRRT